MANSRVEKRSGYSKSVPYKYGPCYLIIANADKSGCNVWTLVMLQRQGKKRTVVQVAA
jgi:hypothetical protein